MNSMIASVCLFGIFIIGLLFNRKNYSLALRLFASRKLMRLGYKLEDVKFSFDRMVYTVSLPTNQPDIMRANKENFAIVEEFGSWIYPQLNGIRVVLNPGQGNAQLIAYLPIEQFRLPLLDQLLLDGKIKAEVYRRICACILILPSTKDEMIGEVYKQIHNKRFS
ncbi:hypothetical protein [Cohnella cholangitidis]|uniref:Uncharacterized protein n=1 Tax=Cohnella cholangitidis TaxID=2598458 RepID=A0A7G5BW94_9BACL|nr:hypothetical protein [Cohnella cholangitidis]QMV41228.1 hypothetical protein FPL14_08495 [Cohnella cholangitidis]